MPCAAPGQHDGDGGSASADVHDDDALLPLQHAWHIPAAVPIPRPPPASRDRRVDADPAAAARRASSWAATSSPG